MALLSPTCFLHFHTLHQDAAPFGFTDALISLKSMFVLKKSHINERKGTLFSPALKVDEIYVLSDISLLAPRMRCGHVSVGKSSFEKLPNGGSKEGVGFDT